MKLPLTLALTLTLPAAAHRLPNVVYIIMDDLGYGDLGCYGQEKIETPNIDALAAHGMRFTQHYTGSPVSAPARCSLLTGMHSGHCQIRGNDELPKRGAVNNHDSLFAHPELEGQAPLREGTFTLGHLMQRAGYRTAMFGKWGLGYPGSVSTPTKMGFDRFYGFNCQRVAHNHYPAFLYDDEQRVLTGNPVVDPHRQSVPQDKARDDSQYERFTGPHYAHDLIYDQLEAFIQTRPAPFFIMWTTTLPHVSLQAPQRWVDYYVRKFGDETPKWQGGYLPCRYTHATYAAMVSYFDEQVGRLVALLKAEGLYDNTLIVFTSDNGPTFNGGTDSPWFDSARPFRSEYGWGKCFVHEGGVRVPAIFTWEGHIKAGTSTDLITWFPDLMPTLAQLTATPLSATDGISFLPTLLGKKQKARHDHLYWEYKHPSNYQKAVRRGPWKAILQNIDKGNSHIELFNLDSDPREEHDIAADHPTIVSQLQAIMEQEHDAPSNPIFEFPR